MMEADLFCRALAEKAHDQIDAQLSAWRDGTAFPDGRNAQVAALLDRLSEDEVETVRFMMRQNAASAIFGVLNVLDGTGDIDTLPEGCFRLTFEHWKGAKQGQVAELTEDNGDFLHDRFMEAHMAALANEGLA